MEGRSHRRDHHQTPGQEGAKGGGQKISEGQVWPCEVTSPVQGQATHLRAKGKLMAAAAEKFRGLSKGLLPAEGRGVNCHRGWWSDPATHLDLPHSPVGTESGDRGLERVGEGVPTTRLFRLPLRQLWRDSRVRRQT